MELAMSFRSLLLTGAIAVSVYAGGDITYPFATENISNKRDPLTGSHYVHNMMDSTNVPLFISLGFDDNRYGDGVDWIRETLLKDRKNPAGKGNKATMDGTPMAVDFYVIGNSDYEWSEDPFTAPMPSSTPVSDAWRRAYDAGQGINNHTWSHGYNLSDLSYDTPGVESPSLLMSLGFCSKYLVNVVGQPVEHIYGMRTPYLASSAMDNASFKATRDIGILYDCTLDNAMQGNTAAIWATPAWPGMMNDGWGAWTTNATKGLWQLPNATYIVGNSGRFSHKGFDSGTTNGWPAGASGVEMFEQMKSAIEWAYNKNRAAVDLGLHSDYYSSEAQNTSGTSASGFATGLEERRSALVMLLDWIEAELPDARVVKKIDIIRWMRNPVHLDDMSRNNELTFKEGDVTRLSNGLLYTDAQGSESSVNGNSVTVKVVDTPENWTIDGYAGVSWNLDKSMAGMHSVRVKYSSDIPLRMNFIQDGEDGEHYGFGLPSTKGEEKTVELPISPDFVEPPRPYKNENPLTLSKVKKVALVAQVFDTTMSGTFTADVELFGGGDVALSGAVSTQTHASMNSFSSTGTSLSLPVSGNYSIELFSLNGKRIFSREGFFNQGSSEIQWGRSLAKGVYLVKIRGNKLSVTLRQAVSN